MCGGCPIKSNKHRASSQNVADAADNPERSTGRVCPIEIDTRNRRTSLCLASTSGGRVTSRILCDLSVPGRRP